MGEQGRAAVMIKFSHEGPQTGDIAGYLPCPVGVAIRPRLTSRSVLDPIRVRCQVRLDRLDADNMRVRAEVEDLRGERMGGRDDRDIRLFAQIEPQPQGAMCPEITNKDAGRRRSIASIEGFKPTWLPAALA